MNRVLWELRRAQWRAGTFGLLAALILLGAVIVTLVDVLPLRRDINEREHDLDVRALTLKQPPPPAPVEVDAPQNADQRYFVFLHSFAAIASKNGIAIPQLSYQTATTEKDKNIKRYLVESTFPGTYAQLRGFIGDLRRLPGVRCERLMATRPDIGATQLEVRLRCSFLVEATK